MMTKPWQFQEDFIIMTRFLSGDTQNLARPEAYTRAIMGAATPMKRNIYTTAM